MLGLGLNRFELFNRDVIFFVSVAVAVESAAWAGHKHSGTGANGIDHADDATTFVDEADFGAGFHAKIDAGTFGRGDELMMAFSMTECIYCDGLIATCRTVGDVPGEHFGEV